MPLTTDGTSHTLPEALISPVQLVLRKRSRSGQCVTSLLRPAVAFRVPDPATLRDIFSALGFVTASQRMTPVLQCAYKAAQVSDTTVLLQGETGTGKQVLARAIHSLDQKRCRF